MELEHCDGIQDLAACGLPGQITTLSLCWRAWGEALSELPSLPRRGAGGAARGKGRTGLLQTGKQ